MRNTVNKKLFAIGALLVAGFTFVNFLVGVAIVENIEKGDPKWMRGMSKLNEPRAHVTDESRANMIWIRGMSKLNESRAHVTDESRANTIWIRRTRKLNESRSNVTNESRTNVTNESQANTISIRETSKLNASRAKITDESRANVTDELQANTLWIKGTSKLNESQVNTIWIRRTSKLNESRANVTDESRANVANESKANTTEHGSPLPVEDRRFPKYGTTAFSRQCSWTEQKAPQNLNCTFLVRPSSLSGEGISNWLAQIVEGHLLAQQTGCNLLFDYGPGINIHEVLAPISNLDSVHPPVNWSVPPGFDCESNPRCFITIAFYLRDLENAIGVQNMVPIPCYRHAYTLDTNYFARMGKYRGLVRALPGFTVETGMACSLASLFHLSPFASTFEPDLFSRILPALHSSEALVISLYLRTGQTEKNDKFEATISYRNRAKPIIDCALNLENENLSQFSFSRIVWMVVSDSQYLKKFITESYDSLYTNDTAIPREIITTRSRGAHSKPQWGPSTADVAEALIDWYLIGESDLVVTDDFAPSFGDTAATRTVRPYYKVQGRERVCGKVVPILK